MKYLMPTLLILTASWSAHAQSVMQTESVSHYQPERVLAEKKAKAALWKKLEAERVSGVLPGEIRVSLSDEDKAYLDCPDCFVKTDRPQGELVGLHAPVDLAFRFDGTGEAKGRSAGDRVAGLKNAAATIGAKQLQADGSFVWTSSIRVEGATALRIHFTNVDLPDHAAIYLFNDAGQAFGPYTGRGLFDTGEFWSNSVFGEEAWIQLHVDSGDPDAKISFDINKVSHLGDRFEIAKSADKEFCDSNVWCVENAECHTESAVDGARNAVAMIIIESTDGSSTCSGGLINDADSSDTIAWFLTAHHCVSTQAEAHSVEAFFRFQAPCGTCAGMPQEFPVIGAWLWATARNRADSDFTLLQLAGLPATRTLLGYTRTEILDDVGTQLYRISHPSGEPQAFSQYGIIPTDDRRFIYSRNVIGTDESGSSGAPTLDANGRIVGQHRGTFTYLANADICNATDFTTRDGALSAYWNSVGAYLDSQYFNYAMHVESLDTGWFSSPGSPYFLPYAEARIVDEDGRGVSYAYVQASFSGIPATGFTNAQGEVTLVPTVSGRPYYIPGQPTLNFCIGNVAHAHFSNYDAASNTATCAVVQGS